MHFQKHHRILYLIKKKNRKTKVISRFYQLLSHSRDMRGTFITLVVNYMTHNY